LLRRPFRTTQPARPHVSDSPRVSRFLSGLSVPAATCSDPRRSGVHAVEAGSASSFAPLQEGRSLRVAQGQGPHSSSENQAERRDRPRGSAALTTIRRPAYPPAQFRFAERRTPDRMVGLGHGKVSAGAL
jgi:hypothetical protein